MQLKNRIGHRYGKLTVVEQAPRTGPKARWICRCDCGEATVVFGWNLENGNSTSCGCSRIQHGMSKTKVHHVWRQMLQRCENPNDAHYANYGGRGVKVCKRWHEFIAFYADMGNPPRGGTLERCENDGPYSKANCVWASRRDQARNKRSSRIIEAFGRKQTLTDWALEYGVHPRTLHNRILRAKMHPEDALRKG